jgi:hypothetical protein
MKKELEKRLNSSGAGSGPWPWPIGRDGPRTGAHRPAGAAGPIREARPSGARPRAQRAQHRGRRTRGVPVAQPPVMSQRERCGMILRMSFSEWRQMRRARSWRTGTSRWSITDEVADGRQRDSVPERRQCSSGSGYPGELLWSERATEG